MDPLDEYGTDGSPRRVEEADEMEVDLDALVKDINPGKTKRRRKLVVDPLSDPLSESGKGKTTDRVNEEKVDLKEKRRKRHRERYARLKKDPEYLKRRYELEKQRYARLKAKPDYEERIKKRREKERRYQTRLKSNPDYEEKIKKRRERQRQYRARLKSQPDYEEKIKKRRERHRQYRARLKSQPDDEEKIKKRRERQRQYRALLKAKPDAEERMERIRARERERYAQKVKAIDPNSEEVKIRREKQRQRRRRYALRRVTNPVTYKARCQARRRISISNQERKEIKEDYDPERYEQWRKQRIEKFKERCRNKVNRLKRKEMQTKDPLNKNLVQVSNSEDNDSSDFLKTDDSDSDSDFEKIVTKTRTPRKINCAHCNVSKTFDKLDDLISHWKSDHPDKDWPCANCKTLLHNPEQNNFVYIWCPEFKTFWFRENSK